MQDEITAQGVEQLLQRSSTLKLVHVPPQAGNTLVQMTTKVQPAVVIIDDRDPLFWRPGLADLFENCPSLRVILVSLAHNRAQVFECREMRFETDEEFTRTIETLLGN